jgi:hypothetical protein
MLAKSEMVDLRKYPRDKYAKDETQSIEPIFGDLNRSERIIP